jgi:hypothetical protein
MWEYACTYVRALTHTYACTNPNTQMHTHIHALHAYNGDTHIHAHITHMQTQVVGVGVEKGSVLVEFLKSSMIMCAWMGARLFGQTPTQTLWWSLGYTIRALQQLQNEFLRNYTNCMRYKLMYARIISEGGDWPPKGGCFSNVHWAWAPVFATVKYGSKWYYLQQLSLQMWGHMLNCPRHEPHFST